MTTPPRKGPKRLADLIRPALEPMLAKRGLSQASLILDWVAIVGARAAALCEPGRLQWPPRGPKTAPGQTGPATLWLRVAPGRALDVQYQSPVIIERVNAHFGWRCVATVKIAPEPKRAAPSSPGQRLENPQARARAATIVRAVTDDGLRAALTRLGTGVLGTPPR